MGGGYLTKRVVCHFPSQTRKEIIMKKMNLFGEPGKNHEVSDLTAVHQELKEDLEEVFEEKSEEVSGEEILNSLEQGYEPKKCSPVSKYGKYKYEKSEELSKELSEELSEELSKELSKELHDPLTQRYEIEKYPPLPKYGGYKY